MVVAVICEYNPFHQGHARQFRLIRQKYSEDTTILCLMSGNFVQRGTPALFSKMARACAAIACGADLVLELPITYALSSAEGFAQGAVSILNDLGVVDALCFGSEHGEPAALWDTAERLIAPEFDEALRKTLKEGISYAAARAKTLQDCGGDASLLRRPNDILAVEYCKALLRLESKIEPFPIERGGDYHDTAPDAEQPSATSLRALLAHREDVSGYMPHAAAEIFRAAPQYTLECGERAMLARLRALTDAEFQALPYGAEGLWSKVMKACRCEHSVEDILSASKSKRYAYSRLMRMLMCAYLGITAKDMTEPAPYVRALAFNSRGAGLVRKARDAGDIPVINAGETPQFAEYFSLECRAANLYTLFARDETDMRCASEQGIRIFYGES